MPMPKRCCPAPPGWPATGAATLGGACRPDLLERLRGELGSDLHQTYLDGPAFRRLWRAVQRCIPNAFTLAGDFRAADAATFAPSQTIDRAEHIAEDDPVA